MKKSPAYSLIFAFVFMTGIMLVAASTIENIHEKALYYRNMDGMLQVKLAAESAMERGRRTVKNLEPGSEAFLDIEDEQESEYCLKYLDHDTFETTTDCDKVDIGYQVLSTAKANLLSEAEESDFYYLPIPNTGNAAPREDSCPDPVFDEYIDWDAIGSDQTKLGRLYRDPAHSCNWNKISFGQTVVIPLYSLDADGNPQNPFATAMAAGTPTQWFFRLRTPCKNASLEPDCAGPGQEERYELDEIINYNDLTGPGTDKTDSILVWEIIGEREDGSTESLRVNDSSEDLYFPFQTKRRNLILNTEITEKMINDDLTPELFYNFPQTDYSNSLQTFLENPEFVKLYFKFQLASPLKNDTTEEKIPGLQWQIGEAYIGVSPIQYSQGRARYHGFEREFSYKDTGTFSLFDNPFTTFTLAD